jgi:transposase
VPNRRSNTLIEIIRDNVHPESILVTDGYPSYPAVDSNLSMDHLIVNHSVGFRNENGDNTNSIENLWSHLKSNLKTAHGVKRSEMENFIVEFMFRKMYIKENRP